MAVRKTYRVAVGSETSDRYDRHSLTSWIILNFLDAKMSASLTRERGREKERV